MQWSQMCAALAAVLLAEGTHDAAALYGFSQALLQAVALDRRISAAEVAAAHFRASVALAPIAVNAQYGDHCRDGH